MVRPILEYGSSVWDPHTQANIKKLEMVNRRAARFVSKDYRRTSSVTSMLNKLQWQTLQERRAQAKVVLLYRIVHQLVAIPAPMLVQPVSVRNLHHQFLVPFARTTTYQHSFFPNTIRLWNSLPATVASCTPWIYSDSRCRPCNFDERRPDFSRTVYTQHNTSWIGALFLFWFSHRTWS